MGRVPRLLVQVVVSAAFLAGCGGGGDDAITLAIVSTSSFDGFVTNTAFVDAGTPISAGDTDGSYSNYARGFVRFDRSGIPAGATIVSAELRMHQSAVFGAPYVTLGNLVVDHVNIGPSLDATDFAVPGLLDAIGVLSSSPTLELKRLNVTAEVLADVAAVRSTSDFRIGFPVGSDADGVDDYVQFDDGEDSFGSGNVPLLVVRYKAP